MARLIFLDAGFVPDFAAGPQSHVGAAVLALSPLFKSEDRAGLHVSFSEGMVSCIPGQGLGLLPQIFCRALLLLQQLLQLV